METPPHKNGRSSDKLTIPDFLHTPSMRRLKDRYGFDTLAARESCIELARFHSDSQLLDVGTGTGWMAMVAACAGHHVVSVDTDVNALREAEARVRQCGDAVADHIEFLEANATCLPFDDEQYDGVLSFEAIHHLPDCRVALTEMCRVTRRHGAIVIADLNERGLRAVRETTLALQGKSHEENACRLLEIEAMVAECAVVERHDLEFISVFIVRK